MEFCGAGSITDLIKGMLHPTSHVLDCKSSRFVDSYERKQPQRRMDRLRQQRNTQGKSSFKFFVFDTCAHCSNHNFILPLHNITNIIIVVVGSSSPPRQQGHSSRHQRSECPSDRQCGSEAW